MELCSIVARQPVRGKLSDMETAGMIKCTAQPATDTFKKIHQTMHSARELFDTDLANIGLEVAKNMSKGILAFKIRPVPIVTTINNK